MMKILLNQKISTLSEDFHKGHLSLSDYRSERRKELEALNGGSEPKRKRATRLSKVLVKRVIFGTCCAVTLLFVTVMVAKLLM